MTKGVGVLIIKYSLKLLFFLLLLHSTTIPTFVTYLFNFSAPRYNVARHYPWPLLTRFFEKRAYTKIDQPPNLLPSSSSGCSAFWSVGRSPLLKQMIVATITAATATTAFLLLFVQIIENLAHRLPFFLLLQLWSLGSFQGRFFHCFLLVQPCLTQIFRCCNWLVKCGA